MALKRTLLSPGVTTMPDVPSGQYFYPVSQAAASTSAALGVGTARVTPWVVNKTISLTRLGVDVSSAGEAGAKFRIFIYADNGTGEPGSLVLDAGQVAADAVATVEATVSLTLTPAIYWIGGAVQAVVTTQPTMRIVSAIMLPFLVKAGTTKPTANGVAVGWSSSSGFTGAPPSTFTAGGALAGSCARIFAKVA